MRALDLGGVGHAQIDRHQQAALAGKGLHGGHVEAVALLAQGHGGAGGQPEGAQGLGHKRRGAHAVHIVIAKHGHGPALGTRLRK